MNKVVVINIDFIFNNITNTIYPVILKDDREVILVDCGYPNFLPRIKEAAMGKNIDLNNITKVIVTHHDYDHMGSLADFKNTYPNIQIMASEKEAAYIMGKKKSLRLQQAEDIYDSLPDSLKEGAKQIQKLFSSVNPADVDVILENHEIFPWCGGVEIVPTPGHMPGHISLYVKEFKTLIAGDALVIENGNLGIANPEYTLDMEAAKQSIRGLLDYDIEKIICYHGGIYDKKIKESLSAILSE